MTDLTVEQVWREIAFHRALRADELRGVIQITAGEVPADIEDIQISEYDAALEAWLPGATTKRVTDSGPLGGPSLSMPMNGLLAEPPSRYYPWMASLFALRLVCMADHLGHAEREAFGGSLCWRVAYLLVVSERDPTQVADDLGIPTAHVLKRFHSAAGWIIDAMDIKDAIRRARDPLPSEEPTPTRLTLLVCDAAHRSVVDFDLEQRIWEGQVGLMRRDLKEPISVLEPNPIPHYVTITRPEWEQRMSWEREWERRQAAFLAHRAICDRCRRAA